MNEQDLSRAVWRKSSYSNGQGGNCVEVAHMPGSMAVRDTKARDGGVLQFDATAWRAFLASIAQGH